MPPQPSEVDSDDAATEPQWHDYVEQSLLPHWRRRAEAAYRAIRRVTGAEKATLDSLLRAIGAEGGEAVRSRLERANFPDGGYDALIATAAFDSGAVRITADWDSATVLETPDGTGFDPAVLAGTLAKADRASVPDVLGGLTKAGIDLERASGGTTTADADTARAKGALANMKLDGRPHDLVVTDEGLLFVGCPKSTDDGEKRLRMLLTAADGVKGLASRPDACWLPFEEFSLVRILKHSPIRAMVTLHDGSEHDFGWSWAGEQIGTSDDLLDGLLSDMAQRLR